MYFWNIAKLKEDIREDRLTETARFIYAFIYLVLGAAFMEVIMIIPPVDWNSWDIINGLLNFLIGTIGIIYAYKANGSGKGVDFLGRYFAIGFVNGIRFLVYAIPIFILQSTYHFYATGDEARLSTSYIDVIPLLIWSIAMYWRLYIHMKQINS